MSEEQPWKPYYLGNPLWQGIGTKVRAQALKDYVFFPALSGPLFAFPLAGNATANIVRNLWSFTIIFCGLPHNVGPLHRQFGSVVKKIGRLALPDSAAFSPGGLARGIGGAVGSTLGKAGRLVRPPGINHLGRAVFSRWHR
jgi:hypothetical protein